MSAVLPGFPGATSVSELEVYDSAAPDGLAGGSPHLHLVSAEAYLVTGGRGRVHSIDAEGFHERPVEAGSVVWFGAGTVHRAVNDGGLRAFVVMSNAGLPEAGDAVLTFPDEVLADPQRYHAARRLPELDPETAARRRRDLAVEGFLELRRAAERGDVRSYRRLLERAAALSAPAAGGWLEAFDRDVASVVADDRARLATLARGAVPGFDAGVRIAGASAALGMCGRLVRAVAEPATSTLQPAPQADPAPTPRGPSL
ncbi:cupin domain-containing protein [Agromyces sp. G08B096]|uniref:Cupin domain-containing protein n=1 Tax=Agromyces sp. G08B096 TaxID=3156399 RepID=A0AAU7W4X9_9MICO